VKVLLNESGAINEYAIIVALMNYAFPVRLLMTYVYALKTHAVFSIKLEDYFDLFISGLISIWLGAYIVFSSSEATNPQLADNRH
jgi:hypothetical protein